MSQVARVTILPGPSPIRTVTSIFSELLTKKFLVSSDSGDGVTVTCLGCRESMTAELVAGSSCVRNRAVAMQTMDWLRAKGHLQETDHWRFQCQAQEGSCPRCVPDAPFRQDHMPLSADIQFGVTLTKAHTLFNYLEVVYGETTIVYMQFCCQKPATMHLTAQASTRAISSALADYLRSSGHYIDFDSGRGVYVKNVIPLAACPACSAPIA